MIAVRVPGNDLAQVALCIPAIRGGRALPSSIRGSADNDPTVDTTPYFFQQHLCLSLPGLVPVFRLEAMQQIAA